MTTQTVTPVRIGRHLCVAGLTWVALTKPRALKKEAREVMRKYRGDCYAVRSIGGAAQAAIGSKDEGHKAGMVAIAAVAGEQVCHRGLQYPDEEPRKFTDWIGIFRLPDEKWLFLAFRDGLVFSGADYIGDYNEAIHRLEETYGLGGWQAVLGAPEIGRRGYHNFREASVEDVLGMQKGRIPTAARYTLSSVAAERRKKGAIAALAVAAISAAAGGVYYKKLADERAAAELAAFRAALVSQPVVKKKVEHEKTWQKQPLVTSFMRACAAHLDAPAAPGSWTTSSIICDQSGSLYVLSRGFSTVQDLKILLPAAIVSESFNEATWHRPFDSADLAFQPSDSLAPWGSFGVPLIAALQTLGDPFSIGPAAPPKPPHVPKEEMHSTEIVPANWMERRFSVGPTSLAPRDMAPLLDKPGVRVTSATRSQGSWKYEGVIYAN